MMATAGAGYSNENTNNNQLKRKLIFSEIHYNSVKMLF
jgi:hypothetical protein